MSERIHLTYEHGAIVCGIDVAPETVPATSLTGGPYLRGRFVCPDCWDAVTFDRAEKVPAAEWDGPLFCDGWGSNEGYFVDLDALEEEVVDAVLRGDRDADDVPDHAWPCTSTPFRLDAERVVEAELENDWYSHAGEQIEPSRREAEAELQKLLDAWCAKHCSGLQMLEEIRPRKRVVVLDRDALLARVGEDSAA